MSDLDPSAPRDPIESGNASADDARRLLRRQRVTVATLCFGYAGIYFCRVNMSVVASELIETELSDVGGIEAMGAIFSAGVVCYALGKLFNGVLCDFVGGRLMFLFAMAGAAVATVVFGLASGFWAFLVIWCVNRAIQSGGWPALIKISSRWFSAASHGRIVGILSLSYLWGDFAARQIHGALLRAQFGWRDLFFIAAAVLAGLSVIARFTLKTSPRDIGRPEPAANPNNLFGENGESTSPKSFVALLAVFLGNFSFWLICFMSFGLTLIRETFSSWTPTYLSEVAQLSPADAASWSGLFPLFGGFSVLAAGFLTDTVAGGKRTGILVTFLAVAIAGLVGLTFVRPPEAIFETPFDQVAVLDRGATPSSLRAAFSQTQEHDLQSPVVTVQKAGHQWQITNGERTYVARYVRGHLRVTPAAKLWIPLVLIAWVSFFMIGPYSFLAGVMSLDLGGKCGPATASGLVDAVGYLGGAIAGWGIAVVAESYGWGMAFGLLAGLLVVTVVAAAVYWWRQEHGVRRAV